MNTLFESADHFTRTLNDRLEPRVKTHLKHVYSTLTATVLSASLGAYLHLYTNLAATLLFVTLGLCLALMFTKDNGKNRNLRLGYLLGIGFFSGFSMGPLIEMTLYIDTSILPTAILSTAFIFGCFTLSAIFSDRRQSLYITGLASSVATFVFSLALMNIFLNSYLIYKTSLYLSFGVMCALVIIDTVRIIDLRARGDTDYIMHACMLFQDLVQIFRHLLVILSEKDRSNKRKKQRD
ncbi:PREDICTED: bax inhibitor 1-like [Rhagoletis zephyria]|uniref:bax inhibitor 1-like n=1 Tax=Rhagoletis zephyria TaxID=28612 RepID=UPI000811771D|nr:PREDICTED: bax inhibitor 1-like [Rhagoletis zephyria]